MYRQNFNFVYIDDTFGIRAIGYRPDHPDLYSLLIALGIVLQRTRLMQYVNAWQYSNINYVLKIM